MLVADLNDSRSAEQRTHTFLQAGGLPVVIRHLRGSAAAGAVVHVDALSCSISRNAATALTTLLAREISALAELSVATSLMPPFNWRPCRCTGLDGPLCSSGCTSADRKGSPSAAGGNCRRRRLWAGGCVLYQDGGIALRGIELTAPRETVGAGSRTAASPD